MRFHDNGSLYSVSVSQADVQRFRASYPCSGIPDSASFWFQFAKSNGDLVDIIANQSGHRVDLARFDGPGLFVLTQVAQEYATARLKPVERNALYYLRPELRPAESKSTCT